MRFAFIVVAILASLLLFGCIQQPAQSTGASNIADKTYSSGRINSTGMYGNISLDVAMSRHVFVIWSSNSSVLTNTSAYTTFTATRTCTNSTTATGVCANTTNIGGGNFSIAAANTSYNLTVVTTNAAFNNTTTFEVDIYGAYLNSTKAGGISVLMKNAQGVYQSIGSLADNSSNWTNVTGLSAATFLSGGVADIMFLHSASGDNASIQTVNIDYVALNATYTYNYTSGALGNVTFQTSLDNVNWFADATIASAGPATRYQTNNTALYARFNVTGLIVPQPDQDGLYINYVAVSN